MCLERQLKAYPPKKKFTQNYIHFNLGFQYKSGTRGGKTYFKVGPKCNDAIPFK